MEQVQHPPQECRSFSARVLLVDDQRIAAELIRRTLMALPDLCFSHCSDPAQALQQAEQFRPTVVLLDWMARHSQGRDLLQELRSSAATRNVPVIALGHDGGAQIKAEALAAGARDYLVKQAHSQELLDRIRDGAQPGPNPAPDSGKRRLPRILLAEDSPIAQRMLLAQLKKLGQSAHLAASGRQVLQALQQTRYDVILMDCQMPELDGFETTQLIRQQEAGSERSEATPAYIIALTASLTDADRQACSTAGMNDFVSKSTDLTSLARALQRWEATAGSARSREPGRAAESAQLGRPPAPSGAVSPAFSPMPESSERPFDVDRLLDMVGGGQEEFRGICDLFMGQTSEILDGLRAAIDASEATEVRRLAHRGAGSCATCGAHPLERLFRALERMGEEGGLQDARSVLERAVAAYGGIKTYLATLPF